MSCFCRFLCFVWHFTKTLNITELSIDKIKALDKIMNNSWGLSIDWNAVHQRSDILPVLPHFRVEFVTLTYMMESRKNTAFQIYFFIDFLCDDGEQLTIFEKFPITFTVKQFFYYHHDVTEVKLWSPKTSQRMKILG